MYNFIFHIKNLNLKFNFQLARKGFWGFESKTRLWLYWTSVGFRYGSLSLLPALSQSHPTKTPRLYGNLSIFEIFRVFFCYIFWYNFHFEFWTFQNFEFLNISNFSKYRIFSSFTTFRILLEVQNFRIFEFLGSSFFQMLRVTTMEILKLSYWNPARNMKEVLVDIKEFLQTWARLDCKSERNDRSRYPDGAYIDIEHHLLRLALVSEMAPRANKKYTSPTPPPPVNLPPSALEGAASTSTR